jgi:hypothetical protein
MESTKIIVVKSPNEIVDYVKRRHNEINNFVINQNLDFKGCSEFYVEEQINILIADLEWLKDVINKE